MQRMCQKKKSLQMQCAESSGQIFPRLCLCSSHCVPCFRYLAATLVINWLSSHEDPTLQRMAVAVISILVAKVKTPLAHCALAAEK